MSWVVAVHRYWPNHTHTHSAEQHVGPFATEADAREFAGKLTSPLIGYVYPLEAPK